MSNLSENGVDWTLDSYTELMERSKYLKENIDIILSTSGLTEEQKKVLGGMMYDRYNEFCVLSSELKEMVEKIEEMKNDDSSL